MIVIVTGARSGFGKLAALSLAERGHTVYAGLRDLGTADEQLLPEAAARGVSDRVVPVQLDVTSATDRSRVVERVRTTHGRVDGLVNNAGIALGGFLEDVDDDEFRKVFEVNVFGLWALTKLVLPDMRARRAGCIVNIGSMSGQMAFPGLGTYAASKHALEGLSEAWHHELGHFGIQVTLLEPGAYATDIWHRNRNICRNGKSDESPYRRFADHMDRLFERVVNRQKRDPQEVAEVVVDVVEGRRRKLRYPLGPDAKLRLFLKKYAPQRFISGVLRVVTTPR